MSTDSFKFEERADFLSEEDINNWTVETSYFNKIQDKLIKPGAKLLVGPRGTGKTHIMKYTYQRCENNNNFPLAIYVSFGKYYHLEPFITKTAHAYKIFHCWVLSKIIYEVLKINKSKLNASADVPFEIEELQEFISQAEKGIYESNSISEKLIREISIDKTIDLLIKVAGLLKRNRIILLLDDAALTLTPEYLIEFFDIFRSLKTKRISPKASVYPGTTEYGPRFHVGHDAEKVDAWNVSTDTSVAMKFMEQVYIKRFSSSGIKISDDIRNIFKIASFGITRTFINLIREYTDSEIKQTQQKFNKVIETYCEFINQEYLSLVEKLPQYKSIIETGFSLFNNMISIIKDDNKTLTLQKQLYIGLEKEGDKRRSRMLKFLIEAGLIFPVGEVKHGSEYNRTYERYIPHIMFLIAERTFSKDRGFNTKEILKALSKPDKKHPLRRKIETMLTEKQIAGIKLDLPPCTKCQALRISESQKFCHQCGSELILESRFEKCMKIKVSDLPILTIWKKDRIQQETDIETIGDILSSESPATELRKARGIGQKRASDIHDDITKYVSEFLS